MCSRCARRARRRAPGASPASTPARGRIDLAPGGIVVIALGTIESARLALASFDGSALPTLPLIGKNLIAHLRSNLVIRVPRAAIPGLLGDDQRVADRGAVREGPRDAANGDLIGRFHLQIAASGGGNTVGGEDELYRKIPDVDFYDQLRRSTDTHVAIAIRGLGEMEPADPNNFGAHASRVDLDARTDEYGVRRGFVTMHRDAARPAICGPRWTRRWSNVAARVRQRPADRRRAGATTVSAPRITRRGRCGWTPTRRAASPTPDGRFHHTENLYAAGPALFPSIGSPNPMLTGIALSRRTGDRIMSPPAFAPDPGFDVLFDGTSFGDWRMSTIRNQPGRDDPGGFVVRRGALESRSGTDLGLLWLTRPTPPRFVLRLQWMMTAPDDNSGVFVGFPGSDQAGLRQHGLGRRRFRLGDPDRRARAARQCADPPDRRDLHLQGPGRAARDRARSASGTITRSPSTGPTSRWR